MRKSGAPADVYDYSVVDMGSAGLLFLIIGYGACECMEWRGISLEYVPEQDATVQDGKEIRFRFHETKGIYNNEEDDLISINPNSNALYISRITPQGGSESQCELKLMRHYSERIGPKSAHHRDYLQEAQTEKGGKFPQSIPTPLPVSYD